MARRLLAGQMGRELAETGRVEGLEGTLWIIFAIAGVAAFAWWRTTREANLGRSPAWVRWSVVAAAPAGSALIGYTAFLGAKITHTPHPTRSPEPSTAAPYA